MPVSECRQSARPSGLEFTRLSMNLWWSLPLLHSLGCMSATSKPCLHVSASPRERGTSVTATCHLHRPPTWLARERAKVAPAALRLHRHHRSALPNPSFKPSPNGVPRGPGRRYAIHFLQLSPRATPSVTTRLKRYAAQGASVSLPPKQLGQVASSSLILPLRVAGFCGFSPVPGATGRATTLPKRQCLPRWRHCRRRTCQKLS